MNCSATNLLQTLSKLVSQNWSALAASTDLSPLVLCPRCCFLGCFPGRRPPFEASTGDNKRCTSCCRAPHRPMPPEEGSLALAYDDISRCHEVCGIDLYLRSRPRSRPLEECCFLSQPRAPSPCHSSDSHSTQTLGSDLYIPTCARSIFSQFLFASTSEAPLFRSRSFSVRKSGASASTSAPSTFP